MDSAKEAATGWRRGGAMTRHTGSSTGRSRVTEARVNSVTLSASPSAGILQDTTITTASATHWEQQPQQHREAFHSGLRKANQSLCFFSEHNQRKLPERTPSDRWRVVGCHRRLRLFPSWAPTGNKDGATRARLNTFKQPQGTGETSRHGDSGPPCGLLCACACACAYSHWLTHRRSVMRTLKMTVLTRSSRRPRTVIETRFTVGSVGNNGTTVRHPQTRTHGPADHRQPSVSPYTPGFRVSSHELDPPLPAEQQIQQLSFYSRISLMVYDWPSPPPVRPPQVIGCFGQYLAHRVPPPSGRRRRPPGWTVSRHLFAPAVCRWTARCHCACCIGWNRPPGTLWCCFLPAGSRTDCRPLLEQRHNRHTPISHSAAGHAPKSDTAPAETQQRRDGWKLSNDDIIISWWFHHPPSFWWWWRQCVSANTNKAWDSVKASSPSSSVVHLDVSSTIENWKTRQMSPWQKKKNLFGKKYFLRRVFSQIRREHDETLLYFHGFIKLGLLG